MTANTCIKNTFIDLKKQPSCALRRNKSVPPSFWSPCNDERPKCDSEDSTDVRTEVSFDDTPWVERCTTPSETSSTPHSFQSQCEPCVQVSQPTGVTVAWMLPVASEHLVQVMHVQGNTRLSSKASAFTPSQQLSKVNVDSHSQIAEMIESARAILKQSWNVESVDLTQGLNGWTIVVGPVKNDQDIRFQDKVAALAKRALFQAAEQSKSVYVLGYRCPEVFTSEPQGFTAQLAVVDGTTSVCWRMLKQGSCHHGADCCKDHPVLQVPVRVFIEAASLAAPPRTIQHYKQDVASFMMIITSILTRISGVEVAAAFNNQASDGWRIEMSIRAEDMSHKERFLTLAKNAFMDATRQSNYVRIMGTGSMPFISKSDGFVTMLGEMSDRSQACWDAYTHGCCWREGACRWQHPQCLMPASVVLKPMVYPVEAEAASQEERPDVDVLLACLGAFDAPTVTK